MKLVQVAVAVVVLVMRRSTVRRSMTPWTLKTRRTYLWRRSKVWGPIQIFSRLCGGLLLERDEKRSLLLIHMVT